MKKKQKIKTKKKIKKQKKKSKRRNDLYSIKFNFDDYSNIIIFKEMGDVFRFITFASNGS